MVYKTSLFLLFIISKHLALSAPSFTGHPGVLRSYRGESVTLRWSLNEPINSAWKYIEFIFEMSTPTSVVKWDIATQSSVYGPGYNSLKVKVDIKIGSPTVSLTLFNLQPGDVRYNYRCAAKYDRFSAAVSNNQGWLLLYGVPSSPVIKRSHSKVKVNQVLTLSCSAKSTTIFPNNLPSNMRPQIHMKYRWQRDHQKLPDDRHRVSGESGNTLTIDKIQREDNEITYTCIAQESGSKLSTSKETALDVMFKPGAANAVMKRFGPYFEGDPVDIVMHCTVSDPGNPKAMFKWFKDGKYKANTGSSDTSYYTISSGQLSVSGHDGTWQCTPYNEIGNGEPDAITVTVYAKPVFVKMLSKQSPRAEIQSDLDVLCSIRGRPAPDVIWQYNDNDLPDGVTVISELDVTKDKLTTVSRRLRWSVDSTLEIRRNTGGEYRCIGKVQNEEQARRVVIDVKFGPYVMNITPSGNIVKTEKDSLTLTCAATCNPQCKYTWSKDGQQISVSDHLEFTSLTKYDQGTYRCTASNNIGLDQQYGINIQVKFAPELSIKVTPSGDLIQGSEITMTCIVDSRPEPSSITWTNITVPGLAPVGCSEKNNTHCWLTLSDINILDSGTYQCQADNGVRGSPVTINNTITVYGPARWYKVDPVDLVTGLSIGDTTDFKIWVIARPLPEQDQWHWKFSPSNSSIVMTTNPGHVNLTVSGDMAVLSITNVTISQFGNYYIWTNNKYGGWNEEDLAFSLKPQGPPLKPVNFSVIDVTAFSIRVEWIAGFNGGLEQTFSIRYTNIATGVVMKKSGIEDRGVGDEPMITDDITDGIEPETEYKLEIFAVNSQGQTAGDVVSTLTPALAKFEKDPEIKIKGDEAEIHFIMLGQLTHMKVENCVAGEDYCVTEDIPVPDKIKTNRQTTSVLYDFIAKVKLVDPGAKQLIFYFWIYDGDVLLTSEPTHIDITNVEKQGGHQQHTESIVEPEDPEGHDNEMFTHDEGINPYGTSQDVGERVVAQVTASSSHQSSTFLPIGEVGPITGDIYAGVKPKRRDNDTKTNIESSRPQISNIQQSRTRPASVFPPENVESSESQPLPTAGQSEVIYAKVDKRKVKNPKPTGKGNQPGSSKKKQAVKYKQKAAPYANVMNTDEKDGVYSEVQVPHLRLSNIAEESKNATAGPKGVDEPNMKPIKLIGEDGTVYADLEIFHQPPSDPDKIHGAENLVQYASIDFTQLKK